MKEKIIYWLPRILSIGFVLFLSIFALDVFGQYHGWELVLALFMHLLPSLTLLIVVILAWKIDFLGALIFLGFAIAYIFMAGFNRPISWYLGISGPSALVGILFVFSWLQKRKKEQKRQ